MFHIWRINSVKSELASSSLSAADGLRYLLAYGIAASIESYVISPEDPSPFNTLDHFMSGAMLLVFILGTIACYRANRAERGRDFLPRYVALAWVLGIRWLVMIFIPMIVLVLAIEDYLGEIPEETSLLEALSALIVVAAFFWRLRHHFSDLDRMSES